jgi:hypothetical protein
MRQTRWKQRIFELQWEAAPFLKDYRKFPYPGCVPAVFRQFNVRLDAAVPLDWDYDKIIEDFDVASYAKFLTDLDHKESDEDYEYVLKLNKTLFEN